MKIAFDAKRAFHNFRGLGNYSRTLIEGLATYYPEHRYILYTPPLNDPRAESWRSDHPELDIRTPGNLVGKAFPSWWRSIFLAKILFHEKLDIYHGLSHELPPGIEKSSLKSFVTIHDLLFLRYPQFFPWIDRQVYRRKFAHSCKVADRVVVICEQTKRDLMESFEVEESKVRVLYQSCHPRFYSVVPSDEKQSVRKRHLLPEHYILNVATFEENKNILGLVRAFHLMRREDDLHLVLIGSGHGEYRQKVEEEIDRFQLRHRIKILSGVPVDDLPAIYQMAEIFVFPSFYEGFGIPIIEALFSGIPVVTSKDGCFPEAGGEGSLYIDPHGPEEIAHALEKLRDDMALRQKLVAKGLEHVQQFHLKRTTAEMMKAYQDAISE